MADNVLALRPVKSCEDVVASLRRLADDIENGEPDWPITTLIVVYGHSDSEGRPDADNVARQRYFYRTHGFGPRTDPFTAKGLLHYALSDWGNEE